MRCASILVLGLLVAGCTASDGGPVNLSPWHKPPLPSDLTADPAQPPHIAEVAERRLIEGAVEAKWGGRSPLRFSDDIKVAATMGGGETAIACGKASARNLYGGYSGEKVFLVGLSTEDGERFAHRTEIGHTPLDLGVILRACGEAKIQPR